MYILENYIVYTAISRNLSEKVHATIPKALWVVLSSLFLKEIWKNWHERPWKCVCWPRTRKFSQLLQARQLLLTFDFWLCSPWSRVGHALRPFFMLWLVKDGIDQNLTGELMRKIYAASWILFTLTTEAERVLCQLVMFLTVFFHWMHKMKFSCYQEPSVIHG